jgi:hypothetical protein
MGTPFLHRGFVGAATGRQPPRQSPISSVNDSTERGPCTAPMAAGCLDSLELTKQRSQGFDDAPTGFN